MERHDERLTYGRTCVYNLNYHIVWGTKYRNKVLTEQIKKDLKSLLYQIWEEKGLSIEHLEIGMDDHVHLLVSVLPKLSMTTIVSCLKGTLVFRLFRMHLEFKSFYWKKKTATYGLRLTMWKVSVFQTNRRLLSTLTNRERRRHPMTKIKRGFRICLYPNDAQKQQIAVSFGCSRWL